MKLPSVCAAGADPFLFALCTGVGILVVSLPVTAYLVLIGRFAFIAWPALSATLIFSPSVGHLMKVMPGMYE